MKKIFKLVLIALSLTIFTNVTFAQSASPSASPDSKPVTTTQDLKFPIKDLGGCKDYKSCSTYCNDPVNNASCIDFAKKNGFYKDDPATTLGSKTLQSAKNDLGCDSKDACLSFCSKKENFDKCDKFAKSQNFIGGYVNNPEKPQYIDKAKEVLGCNSSSSCASFCDNPANKGKCDQFATQVGLLGGNTPQGPGGCTSQETCKSFCSDPANFDKCKSAAPQGQQFSGPGGCSSPESCRSYCEQNSNNCRSYAPGSSGAYVPASCPAGQFFGPGGSCTSKDKTSEAASCAQGGKFWSGSSCQDKAPSGINPNVGGAYFQPRPEMGNCKTPGECYDFCKQNPSKCAGFDSKADKPKDGYIPSLYYTPGTAVKFEPKKDMGGCDSPGGCYDFCKQNPGKCGGFDTKAPRPLDTFAPGTYYTPSSDYQYFTPPATSFYVTPVYFTPPAGSKYSTPSYYTPGTYATPAYYTPLTANYSTPSYYTPGTYYPTPQDGKYTTPTYPTPRYYTPPTGSNYPTPSYYTPPTYVTPNYFTPPAGSTYASPTYITPAAYSTPSYYTPYTGGGTYTTPYYYTPPAGSNYTTPNYPTPPYYSPGSTTSYTYPTPGGSYVYPTPSSGPTPSGGSYTYPTPGASGSPYTTPTSTSTYYNTPTGSYSYPSPGYYPSPSITYPTPSGTYSTPSSYPTPSSATPPPPPPPSYSTPSAPPPPPAPAPPPPPAPAPPPPPAPAPPPPPAPAPPPPPAPAPPPPPPPSGVHGISTSAQPSWWQQIQNMIFGK